MGSSFTKHIWESVQINNKPPRFAAIDELDKIYGFHPFSLKNHAKEVEKFVKSKFSNDLDSLLQQAISKDDQEAFTSLLNKSSLITLKDFRTNSDHQKLKLGSHAEVPMTNILSYICKSKALRCAKALLESDNIGFVELNVKIPWESALGSLEFTPETMPLNWAAAELSGQFIKLFRRHWARIDESHLLVAIATLRKKLKWQRGDSIAKLMYGLGLPGVRNDLDIIRSLIHDTKVVERAFQAFLDDLSVDGLAILMIVARKKLRSLKCRQYVKKLCKKGKLCDQNEDLTPLKLLITMFEGSRSALYFHLLRDKNVSYKGNFKICSLNHKNFRTIHTKAVGFSGSPDQLGTNELKENASENPTTGTLTYQNARISQHTSTFNNKDHHHFSTLFPNIQPGCVYYLQKSKFCTQSSGNADTLIRSLRRADKGFVPQIALCRRLAILALGIRRKTLHI